MYLFRCFKQRVAAFKSEMDSTRPMLPCAPAVRMCVHFCTGVHALHVHRKLVGILGPEIWAIFASLLIILRLFIFFFRVR